MTCNGPGKPSASRPFLYPPFTGWTSIVSYVDHDLPSFTQDGLIITATGLAARPDDVHVATDFPAYWNSQIRQYLYYDGHNGYDYNLYYQPVYAAASGKVIFAGAEYPDALDHGYGIMVLIDHRNGYITLYGHFSKLLVKKGQKVKRGQEIGISGNTGHSTGPHLHFTVFHNCSPVDPYGWAGDGPDPLASYQGQTSSYLWARPPLVLNPLPHWPGIVLLPATTAPRLLLLRLPSTAQGPAAFVRELRAEAQRVVSALGPGVRGVHIDMLRGALDITAPVTAVQLYSLPDVAGIGSMDVAGEARADLLAALARAALAVHARELHLSRSHGWTGILFHWQGQTFLLGKGPKSRAVSLRFAHGKRVVTVQKLRANPQNGAYAVDLGRLSRHDALALRRALQGTVDHHSTLSVQPVRTIRAPARVSERKRNTSGSQTYLVDIMFAGLLLGCAMAAAALRRWRVPRSS